MYFPPTFLVYFETNLITVFFLPFSSLQMLPIPLSTLLIIHISFHQYLINILIFNQMLICAYMYLHIHTHICSMYVCMYIPNCDLLNPSIVTFMYVFKVVWKQTTNWYASPWEGPLLLPASLSCL